MKVNCDNKPSYIYRFYRGVIVPAWQLLTHTTIALALVPFTLSKFSHRDGTVDGRIDKIGRGGRTQTEVSNLLNFQQIAFECLSSMIN